jgi:hypothetical protein
MSPDVFGEPCGQKRMLIHGFTGKHAVNVLTGLKGLRYVSVLDFTDIDVTSLWLLTNAKLLYQKGK